MRRREFIGIVGFAAAWPFEAHSQQTATRNGRVKIGVLWHAGSPDQEREYLDVLMKAFGELGYEEGKNSQFLHRFPAENPDLFRAMARELAENKPDVIVAVTQTAARELKRATSTIPIVFVLANDPVQEGFGETLARPGGNMTGLATMAIDTAGKRMALLREVLPNLHRVALVVDLTFPVTSSSVSAVIGAATSIGLETRTIQVATADDVDKALSEFPRDNSEAAVFFGSMIFNERARIGKSVLTYRVPAMSSIGELVPYGVLMSYGQDFPQSFRRAVVYVDKILKGEKPADLPIEQPTRFKHVVNLRTAKILGINIPPSLLAIADEVIE